MRNEMLFKWASLVAQLVNNLPSMQETWVWSLGGEDALEKETATHSSILAWKTPWMEKPGGLQSWSHKESDMTEWLHFTSRGIKQQSMIKRLKTIRLYTKASKIL